MTEANEIEGKVGNRFTIVIPKKIREKMQLREGEAILIRLTKGKILIETKRGDPFEKLDEVAGDIKFNRHSREKAEELAFEEVESS